VPILNRLVKLVSEVIDGCIGLRVSFNVLLPLHPSFAASTLPADPTAAPGWGGAAGPAGGGAARAHGGGFSEASGWSGSATVPPMLWVRKEAAVRMCLDQSSLYQYIGGR
jgi:hypothetical protein